MSLVDLKQWSFFRSMTDEELIAYARTSPPEEAQEIAAVMTERFAPQNQTLQAEKDIQHA